MKMSSFTGHESSLNDLMRMKTYTIAFSLPISTHSFGRMMFIPLVKFQRLLKYMARCNQVVPVVSLRHTVLVYSLSPI